MKKITFILSLIIINHVWAYDFVIKGNARTKSSFIKLRAQRCLEEEDGRYHKAKFDQCLFNERVFVKVSSTEKNSIITIKVEDKWTLIPVPNYRTDGSDRTVGIYLVESNFLGRKKLLVLGGAVSNKGNSFFLMHRDPSVFQSRYTLLTKVYKATNEMTLRNRENTLYSMEEDLFAVAITPGYQFNRRLNFSVGPGYTEKKYSKIDGFKLQSGHFSSNVMATLSYNDTHYKLFFNEGIKGRLIGQYDITTNEKDNRYSFDLNLDYQKVLFGGQVLQLKTMYHKEWNTEYHLTNKYGGNPGFRGIKDLAIWTDQMMSLAIDYQLKIKELDSGVITVAPFFDMGSYHKIDSRQEYNEYISYGAGIYYYIKKIDLPAMGFQAGNNPKHMGQFFGFYIGSGG